MPDANVFKVHYESMDAGHATLKATTFALAEQANNFKKAADQTSASWQADVQQQFMFHYNEIMKLITGINNRRLMAANAVSNISALTQSIDRNLSGQVSIT
jgi:uncharacterized protein YukE